MSGLVEFLRASLVEDEAVARAASAEPWRHDPAKEWRNPEKPFTGGEEAVFAGMPGARATTICCTGPADDKQSMADAKHIARWDPARVLTEIAAKRAILARYETHARALDLHQPPIGDSAYRAAAGFRHSEALLALLDLAQPYAWHQDFDPDWRIES